MKKIFLLSFVLLALLLSNFSNTQAQAPKVINYQGSLMDESTNQPYDGNVAMTFEIYDGEFGGSPLWIQSKNINVVKGYFNVNLGEDSPINLDFDKPYWLQISISGNAYPRTMLTSSPYAFQATKSDLAKLAEEVEDGSVTIEKLADEVRYYSPLSDLTGELPDGKLKDGVVFDHIIRGGGITQSMLSPNVTARPSGPAHGDLTGTYPDPVIAPGAVTGGKIADGAITLRHLATPAMSGEGTILVWDGTQWVESHIHDWERGKILDILAGDATYVTMDEVDEGFYNYTIGVADGGITTDKLADGAVTTDKIMDGAVTADKIGMGTLPPSILTDGTIPGQVIYWDNIAMEWVLVENAPANTQVLKWLYNDSKGYNDMQWADDAMTIPFEYSLPVGDNTMFSLTKVDAGGNVIEATVNHAQAGHALVAQGSGITADQAQLPVAVIHGESDLKFPSGVLYVHSDVNTIDDGRTIAGLFNQHINFDQGNPSNAVAANIVLQQGTAGTAHSAVAGISTIETGAGVGTGLYGRADGAGATTNVGAVGSAHSASAINIGLVGVANYDEDALINDDDPWSAGLYAGNEGGEFWDVGMYADAVGEGVAGWFVAEDSYGVIIENESTDGTPSMYVRNYGGSRAVSAVGSMDVFNWKPNEDTGIIFAGDFRAYAFDNNGPALGLLGAAAESNPFPNVGQAGWGSLSGSQNIGTVGVAGYDNQNAVIGTVMGLGESAGIMGVAEPGSGYWAGYFMGDVNITGTLNVPTINATDINTVNITSMNAETDYLTVNNEINAASAVANLGETTVNGDLAVTGNAMVDMELHVNGTTHLWGDLMVHGSTMLEDLTATDITAQTITAPMAWLDEIEAISITTVGLEATIIEADAAEFNTLSVLSSIDASGAVANLGQTDVNGDLTVSGQVVADGEIVSLTSVIAPEFYGDLFGNIFGGSIVGDDLDIAGDGMFGGNVDVAGNVMATEFHGMFFGDLEGNVTGDVTGDLYGNVFGGSIMGDDLDIAGDGMFGGNLVVTGTVTADEFISDTFTADLFQGGDFVGDNLTLNENALIGGDLNVDGVTNLNGDLFVTTDFVMVDANDIFVSGNTVAESATGNAVLILEDDDALLLGENTALVGFSELEIVAFGEMSTVVIGDYTEEYLGNYTSSAAVYNYTGDFSIEGNVNPAADDTYSLGADDMRWADLYLGPGSLNIGVSGNAAVVGYNTVDNRLTSDSDLDLGMNDIYANNGYFAGTVDISGDLDVDNLNVNGMLTGTDANFSGAVTAATLAGDGSAITNVLFDNIASGTNDNTLLVAGTLNPFNGGTVEANVITDGIDVNLGNGTFESLTVNGDFEVFNTDADFTVYEGEVTAYGLDAVNIISDNEINLATVGFVNIFADDVNLFGDLLVDGDIVTEGLVAEDVIINNLTVTGDFDAVDGNFSGTVSASNFIGDLTGDVTGDLYGNVFGGNVDAVDGTFSGDLSAVNGMFSGDLSAVNGMYTGDLSAVNGMYTGDLSAVNGTYSGDLSAVNGMYTGDLSAVNGMFSGDVDAVNGTYSGDLSAVNGTYSGDLEAVNGTYSGDLSAVNGMYSGDLEAVNGTYSGDLSAVNGMYTGDLSAVNGMYTGDLSAENGMFNADVSAMTFTQNGNAVVDVMTNPNAGEVSGSYDAGFTVNAGAITQAHLASDVEFATFNADAGTYTLTNADYVFNIVGGTNITTDITGNDLTINASVLTDGETILGDGTMGNEITLNTAWANTWTGQQEFTGGADLYATFAGAVGGLDYAGYFEGTTGLNEPLVSMNQLGADGAGLEINTLGGTGLNVTSNAPVAAAVDVSNNQGDGIAVSAAGIALEANADAATATAIVANGSTDGYLVEVNQGGNGAGMSVDAVEGTALNVANNSASAPALDVANTGVGGGIAVFTAGASGAGVDVLVAGANSQAIYAEGNTTNSLVEINNDGGGAALDVNAGSQGTAINATANDNMAGAIEASNSGEGPAITASSTVGLAFEVTDGNVALSYLEVAVDGGGTLALPNYAIVNVTAGGEPTTVNGPSFAQNGQIMYVANNSGADWTGVGIIGDLLQNEVATVVYIGGTWLRVK